MTVHSQKFPKESPKQPPTPVARLPRGGATTSTTVDPTPPGQLPGSAPKRQRPGAPIIPIPATPAERLANGGPYVSALAANIDSLEMAVESRLTKLALPASKLLAAVRSAASLISVRDHILSAKFNREVTQLKKSVDLLKSQPGATLEDNFEMKLQADAIARLAEGLIIDEKSQAPERAKKILDCAQELENAVAKMRLDALGIGRETEGLDLEGLLRAQILEKDLADRSPQELARWWTELQRLDPEEARRVEHPLLRVVKAKADIHAARKRASQVPDRGQIDRDRLAAMQLKQQIEAAQQLRIGPELTIFESEIRPGLAAIIRAAIGVDIKELDRQQFEAYGRHFRPEARLHEIPLRMGWDLRQTLAALPTSIRRHIPAKLYGSVG